MVTITRRIATVGLAGLLGVAMACVVGAPASAAGGHSFRAGKVHQIPGRVYPLSVGCTPGHAVSAQTCQAVVQNSSSSSFLAPVVKGKPKPAGPAATGGIDIACTSAARCLVVGSDNQQPTMEWFHGDKLTTTVTVSGASYLQGVACHGANRCVAVGYLAVGDATRAVFASVSASSTAVTAKRVSGVSGLQDVACPTTTCVAVGGSGTGAVVTIKPGHRPTVRQAHGTSQLTNVSCGAASTCWATANASSPTKGVISKFLKIKNGKPGHPQKAPEIGHNLACTSASTCYLATATGQYGAAKIERVSRGRAKGSVTVGKLHYGAPTGITCPTATSCLVTGPMSFHNPGAGFYYLGGVVSLKV